MPDPTPVLSQTGTATSLVSIGVSTLGIVAISAGIKKGEGEEEKEKRREKSGIRGGRDR